MKNKIKQTFSDCGSEISDKDKKEEIDLSCGDDSELEMLLNSEMNNSNNASPDKNSHQANSKPGSGKNSISSKSSANKEISDKPMTF